MKKILALLLTAALICGAAIAIAKHSVSSAETAGNVRFEGYVVGDANGNSLGDWIGFWDTDPAETTQYTIFVGTLGAAYYDGSIYGYLYGYNGEGTLITSYYTMNAKTHIPVYI